MTTIQADDSNPFGEAPRDREYVIEGVKVIAQRKDPYGFFWLTQEKGKLPDKYTGAYTSTFEVERALKVYENELKNLNKESK